MTINKEIRVAVVGGGVTGLTFALAALRRGLVVDVFEKNPEITEIGAGISFGPNAARILESLGIEEQLAELSSRAGSSHYSQHDSTEPVLKLDRQGKALLILRAEFVKLLASKIPQDRIHLSKSFSSISDISNGKTKVEFKDGTSFTADIVIGVDGIHSKVRSQLFGDQIPQFGGQVMYRDVLAIKDLKKKISIDLTHTHIIVGPNDRHVVLFPMKQNTLVAVAAIVPASESQNSGESWLKKGSIPEVLSLLDGFHPDVLTIFDSLSQINIYGLYERKKLDTWVKGNIALAGDAAHAMLPHQGQGGSQGVEDAYALALSLTRGLQTDPNFITNINGWLRVYEKARKIHADDVALTSRRMGYVFNHLQLNEKALDIIKNNFKWIHSSDPAVEVEKAVFEFFGPELAFEGEQNFNI